jgi:PKD repeat protein
MKQQRFSRAFVFIILALGALSIWIPSGCDKLVTETNNNTYYDSTLGTACFACHSDASNNLARARAQWENSRHAKGDLIDATTFINGKPFEVNQCGPKCHSHEQFVKDVDSVSIAIKNLSPISCFTCHKPHTGAYGTWTIDSLRGWDDFVLLANGSRYRYGKSNSCAHCHQARQTAPVGNSGSVTLAADWGPHWGPQADVLGGTGGFRFEDSTFEGKHDSIMKIGTQNGCLKCHFGMGQGTQFAEHSFRLEDTVASQQYVENCNQSGCHAGSGAAKLVTNFYDTISFPILASIARNADSLEALLKGRNILTASDTSGLRFNPDSVVHIREAQVLYNYLMHRMDGSRGVHNPEYIDFLLRQSVRYFDSIPPEGQFVADITSGCSPFVVQFTATYERLVDSVRWDFGDGSPSSNLLQPTHSYSGDRPFTVTLIVIGPAGRDTTIRSNYIVANSIPVTSFVANATTGCDSLAVTFTSTSTGTITSRRWDFGDGSSSDSTNPSHTYLTPGQYSVTLIDSGPCGMDTFTRPNFIRLGANPPVAQFLMDTTVGCDSLAVAFTDQSTGDIDSWKWFFGDGDSSLVQNPVHTYRQLNITLYPQLIVTGPCGVDAETSAVAIIVRTLPIAEFSADNTTIVANSQVGFFDESINAAGATRIWDYGDGLADTTTAEFRLHTYTTPGTYTVTLTVTNQCGQDIEVKVNYILVQ